MSNHMQQLDTYIDRQLGLARYALHAEPTDLPLAPEMLDEIVQALVADVASMPEFKGKQAVRSRVLTNTVPGTARRPSRNRAARRRGRLIALGAICALLSTTGAAFAGVLPEPVQQYLARAAEKIGVDLPRPAGDTGSVDTVAAARPATAAPTKEPATSRPRVAAPRPRPAANGKAPSSTTRSPRTVAPAPAPTGMPTPPAREVEDDDDDELELEPVEHEEPEVEEPESEQPEATEVEDDD